MKLNFAAIAAVAALATALSGPASAQLTPLDMATVIGASIGRDNGRKPCTVLVTYEERSTVWRDNVHKLHGVTVETFWTLARTDPKAAVEMITGGKKGGIKGMDGVVRPVGPSLLEGLPLQEGPFTLVKFTYEGLGKAARGVWKSADGTTLQTVDFRFHGWRGQWDIHRIVISGVEHAPPTPDTMCSMAKEAPPLW